MSIGMAVSGMGAVYLYDERGFIMGMLPGGMVAEFTKDAVSIIRDNFMYVYDNCGRCVSTCAA